MINNSKKIKLGFPLYCITCEKYSLGRSNIEVSRDIFRAGAKILQYREKEKSKKEKFEECLKIKKMALKARGTFIVNDDVDLALAVKADGVHLGQKDIPLEIARKLLGKDMIIGVSTHSAKQARQAVEQGADYIGVGPIYPTQTKEDACPAVGLQYLDYAVSSIRIPFVVIGGIKRHNLGEVKEHGARCVAMVTEIVSAPDIILRVKQILTYL